MRHFALAGLILLTVAGSAAGAVSLDRSTETPVVRVTRGEKTVFEYRFETPQHIYGCEESPSGHYLLVWHMERPPRRLKVFRLTDGAMVADCAPGFGGRLQWTHGDKILHSWGCGTNCQNVCVYDITGATLHEENVTGHILTRRGFYIVFPTVHVAARKGVYKYDVNTGRATVLLDPVPAIPIKVHIDEDTLIIRCDGQDEIRLPLAPRSNTRVKSDAASR